MAAALSKLVMITPRPDRRGFFLVVAESTAVQCLASFAMLALPAIAPDIAADLHVPPSLVGIQISLAYGGAMCTSLLAGLFVRRLGAVRTSQTALILCTLACLGLASGQMAVMALGTMLLGFGYGMINPAASHLLMKATTPENRNLVFSIKQTGVPLGGTLAGATLPVLAISFGWPWALLCVGTIALILAVLLQPARPLWDGDRDPQARLTGNPLVGLRDIWQSRALRSLSLTGFAYAAVQLSMSTFAVTMLVRDLHWSLVQAGFLLSCLQIAGVVGRVAAGSVADRWLGGRRTLAVLGLLTALAALCTGLLRPETSVLAVYPVMIGFGAMALGWNGVYLAELAHCSPQNSIPRITGASLFFTYGGVLMGPSLFAALQGILHSYTLTYAACVLPALGGAFLLYPHSPTAVSDSEKH